MSNAAFYSEFWSHGKVLTSVLVCVCLFLTPQSNCFHRLTSACIDVACINCQERHVLARRHAQIRTGVIRSKHFNWIIAPHTRTLVLTQYRYLYYRSPIQKPHFTLIFIGDSASSLKQNHPICLNVWYCIRDKPHETHEIILFSLNVKLFKYPSKYKKKKKQHQLHSKPHTHFKCLMKIIMSRF